MMTIICSAYFEVTFTTSINIKLLRYQVLNSLILSHPNNGYKQTASDFSIRIKVFSILEPRIKRERLKQRSEFCLLG